MAILKTSPRRFWPAIFIFAFVLVAGAQSLDQPKAEALYLIKFLHYISWPQYALPQDHDLVVGVLGVDTLGDNLYQAAEGEKVDSHNVVVRHLRRTSDALGCQVVFISPSERSRVGSILDALRHHSILTVSDIDPFCNEGGMIRFIVENGRLRFRINLPAVRDANISISSKLLELAEVVNGPGGN